MATSISLAAQEWIVPDKRLSAAAGLSDEVRALIAGMGPPDYEKMASIKPQTREVFPLADVTHNESRSTQFGFCRQ